MTEDKAKTSRCCGPDSCGQWQFGKTDEFGNTMRYCIGNTCMAWRWSDDFIVDAPIPDRQGHCGLAGKE